MTPQRSRVEVRDGAPVAVIPAEVAAQVAEIVERAFGRMPPTWYPPTDLADAVAALRCARFTPVSDLGQPAQGESQTGPVNGFITVTELAVRLGKTPRTIRRLCERSGGPFPGARRGSGGWLIPVDEVDRYEAAGSA